MKKKCVLVMGTFEYKAVRKGDSFTTQTLDLLDEITDRAGVDAVIVVAMQDPFVAGKPRAKIKQKDIVAEQPRVLSEIGNIKPDFVMCLGPVATACVFGKGNLAEGEMLRKAHDTLGEGQPPVYVTFGMDNIRYKAGLAKWLALDVEAAAHGHSEPQHGDYTILQPDQKGWNEWPPQLAYLIHGQP